MVSSFSQPLIAALDALHRDGRTLHLWLRDDDAVSATPALMRLDALMAHFDLSCLLAVIPQGAEESLAAFCASHPYFVPCQHGFAHTNHAREADGKRARAIELGVRPVEAILRDLEAGKHKLTALFGNKFYPCLVPPWNRIDDAVCTSLSQSGYKVLSTFGAAKPAASPLPQLNATLDVIDWRATRSLRAPHKLRDDLIGQISAPYFAENANPVVGILTHHLIHDAPVWDFLHAFFALLSAHPAVRLTSLPRLLHGGVAPAMALAPKPSSTTI